MSQEYESRVEGYAPPVADDVIARAGLTHAVGAVGGAAFAGVAAMMSAFAQEVGRQRQMLQSELAAAGTGILGAQQSLRRGPMSTMTRLDASIQHLNALDSALNASPVLRAACLAESRLEMGQLRSTVREMTTGSTRRIDETIASQAVSRFQNVVDRGVQRLARAEAAALRDGVCAALASIGFHCEHRLDDDHTKAAILAHSGDASVAVTLDVRRGHMAVDFDGFEGMECQKARESIMKALDGMGFKLATVAERLHRSRKGGTVMRRVRPFVQSRVPRVSSGIAVSGTCKPVRVGGEGL